MVWHETEHNVTAMQAQTELPSSDLTDDLRPILDEEAYLATALFTAGVGLLVSVFGMFTNSVNILTFTSMGAKDGVTTLFMGMACFDLVYVILSSISDIAIILQILEKRQILSPLSTDPFVVEIFSQNNGLVMAMTTAFTSTFLAVARCMCVVRPLQFKNLFTRGRSLTAMAFGFLVTFAPMTAFHALMDITKRSDKAKNASRFGVWVTPEGEKVKDVMVLLFHIIVPFSSQIIIVVCVAVMIAKLREAANFRNRQAHNDADGKGSRANKLMGKDRQVVVQVVLICIIYLITNIPRIIYSLFNLIEPRFYAGMEYANLHHVFASCRSLFDSINASVNLFVYYRFSQSFRSACFLSKTKPS